jgi:ankyrin repeat protein
MSSTDAEEWWKSVKNIHVRKIPSKLLEEAPVRKYATALQAAIGAQQSYLKPQSEAVRNTRLEIVQLLLRHGADVNAESPDFGDALQIAIRENDKDLTVLLLDHGADINAKRPGEFRTALQAAASSWLFEDTTILKLLLDRGAEINTIGGIHGTALAAAANRGPYGEDNVRILLEHGAFANMRGGPEANSVNPLHAAIRYSLGPGSDAGYGHEPVVKMLVEAGARIDDIPKKWRSKVHAIINPSSCCIQ